MAVNPVQTHGKIQNEDVYIVVPWEARRELKFLTLAIRNPLSFQSHGVCYK